MKKYLIIIILFALSLYIQINYTLYVFNSYPVQAGYVAGPKVKAAMKYHGLRFEAESDSQGNLTFKRDGQKCRLFTEAFEKWWSNFSPIMPLGE